MRNRERESSGTNDEYSPGPKRIPGAFTKSIRDNIRKSDNATTRERVQWVKGCWENERDGGLTEQHHRPKVLTSGVPGIIHRNSHLDPVWCVVTMK